MKSIQELAQTLLKRRSAASPMVMPGELVSLVGPDGMQEALQRRWVIPISETGHLQLNTATAIMADMDAIAAQAEAPVSQPETIKVSEAHGMYGEMPRDDQDCCPNCGGHRKGFQCGKCGTRSHKASADACPACGADAHSIQCRECGCCPCDSDSDGSHLATAIPEAKSFGDAHGYAIGHSLRPKRIHELMSPATGHDSGSLTGAPASTNKPQPTNPTAPPTSPANKAPGIGDSVMVADQGKSYTGTVQSTNNGKYKVSFGAQKPAVDREYAVNELRSLSSAQPAA